MKWLSSESQSSKKKSLAEDGRPWSGSKKSLENMKEKKIQITKIKIVNYLIILKFSF